MNSVYKYLDKVCAETTSTFNGFTLHECFTKCIETLNCNEYTHLSDNKCRILANGADCTKYLDKTNPSVTTHVYQMNSIKEKQDHRCDGISNLEVRAGESRESCINYCRVNS